VLVAVGVVGERWEGRGLGSELVRRVEAAAAEHGAARIHQNALAGNTRAAALFAAHGYREVRRFYDMAIELARPPAPPPEADVEIAREGEERAFHAALEEAFADHWEHHPSSFEDWWREHAESPNFDRSLWFVVRDGDEIAAASRNEANRNGGGYVGAIAVRRPWRGKGYAKALLQHAFREFYERGFRRVTLGVDAENPTGATHLYERVGMHVEIEFAVYEKAVAA
jgi:ribosomal protein S18 acetylase RimI-like enzyme